MIKVVILIASLVLPNISAAQTCADDDRAVGQEISKIFYMMRKLYLENTLSHLFMDRIMTEMHLKYNNEYRLAFQIAVRHSPNECVTIRNLGIGWAKSYKEIILNEVNSRNG